MAGKLIVIEGVDGAGKGTQTELLKKALLEKGHPIVDVDFPRYGEKSAFFVEQYLNGAYGKADEVGPYKASLFFALDRFAASKEMYGMLDQGSIIIANRYETSNRAFQGQKIEDPEKRKEYFDWSKQFEYEILGIPRPDLVICLHVSPEIGQKLVAKKGEREYIKGKTHDIHEEDIELLRRTEQVYLEMAKDPEWKIIECEKDGHIMSKEEIHQKVIEVVLEFLKK